jgi:ABC-2 type transport system permease protein
MRDTLVIAKREFIERVRTKWFVATTVLGPFMMIALIVVPALLATSGLIGARVQIVDQSGEIGEQLKNKLAEDPRLKWTAEVVPATTAEDVLLQRIATKQINGYIVVPPDLLLSSKVEVQYKGDNGSNQAVGFYLQGDVQAVALEARARAAGVKDDQLKILQGQVLVAALHTTGKGEAQSGAASFILGYLIAFILYMVITLYGINVMRSVVTEKSSRVIELLVASTKPRALMAGKIVGVGGAGLVQVAIWFVFGGIALAYREELLSALHVASRDSSLPDLSALQIGVIIIYFVLGYLFYSAMYAAMGATISNDQDTQQAQMPITMFLVIGMVMMTGITGDPRGSNASVITQVPFWSPMLMPLRFVLGGASTGEVAMSLGILLASTYLVTRAGAKIYRVGILMYGKRPGVRELLRWLRY